MGKPVINRAELKKRAAALIKSAEAVILEGTTRAAGFKDSAEFKRALLADLAAYEPFHVAVQAYHGKHTQNEVVSGPAQHGRKNTGGSKNSIQKGSGHVQASRFDPSTNQKDRRRGKREAGGRRVGKGQGKSSKA